MGDFLHLIGGAVVGAVCTVFVQRAMNGRRNGSNGTPVQKLAAARELADITASVEQLFRRLASAEANLTDVEDSLQKLWRRHPPGE